MKASFKKPSLEKALPWLLVIGGLIGLICAFIIMQEKLTLMQNASYQPSCDLNPVISCGSVMKSKQSHAFGFPNPLIGLVAFPVLITIGMGIFAGARFTKRWFWLGLQAGTIFGVVFVHWLMVQSVYYIHALCPYCMVVWTVTIITFWYVTLYNLQKGYIPVRGALQRFAFFVRRHHLDILVFWFLVLFVLIMQHFWYYYGPLLGFK